MNHPVPLRRRAGALIATAGLAAAGLVALTAPANAAVPTLATAASGSFDWKVSTTFDTSFATHELTGTTEDDATGVISFPASWSTVDPATGEGTVQYDGAVKGSFVAAGATQYWVKIEDPAVVVDADGEGRITAEVSAWNTGGMGSAEASTTPARVVVTTFDAAGKWSTKSIAATPDWAGVLPADSAEATALGIAAGQPQDGKAFAPSFLGQITSGVRARFHWTASGSESKAPAPFTATYADVAKTVTTTTTYAAQQASIKVDGTGFIPAEKPGDNGVYVGLAPAGGLPDVSSQAGMSAFAASQWVPAAAIRSGAFSTTLTAAGTKLDRTKAYAVYTWRAHARSSASQDSQTAVTLDWSQLTATTTPPPVPTKGTTTVAGKVTKKPTTKKGGTLAVSFTSTGAAPTGKVTVKLTRKGAKAVNRTAKVTAGKAVVKLPKLKAGAWKATITYAGSDTLQGSTKVVKFTVKKAPKAKKK